MALPFNPNPAKTSISMVFLESEINDVLKELTSKNILSMTIPSMINWNKMIDQAIAFRAAHGGCGPECLAASHMKIPTSTDVYFPLYLRMKSAAFDFGADGRIFFSATIGIFVPDEKASFDIRFETTPQLAVGSTLQWSTTTQSDKPISTEAFQSGKLSLCLDASLAAAENIDFHLDYNETLIRDALQDAAEEEIEKAAATLVGKCYTLTEGLVPPRATFAKGQMMEYPKIKVSDGLLELKTKLIVPKDFMPAIYLLLLN